jgi:hypothetical protein
MAKKRMPAAETHRETTAMLIGALLLMVVEEPAGYRVWCPDRESGLTWPGGPARNDDDTGIQQDIRRAGSLPVAAHLQVGDVQPHQQADPLK